MNVTLPPDQLKWLEAQVEAGRFNSVDEALVVAVADLKAMRDDDLAWAKPYIDQARASIERGDASSGEDFLRRLDGRLERLRSE